MIGAILRRQWFVFALIGLLYVGFSWSTDLSELAENIPRNSIVAGVLFLMSLPLDIRAMGRTLSRPTMPVLAVAMNSVTLPLVGWLAAQFVSGPFAGGMVLATAVPCTLASAAVWTRRAGGNDSIALMVTVVTNLACFLVTPFWISVLASTSVEMPRFTEMASRLALLVVAPIVAAQVLRLVPRVPPWAAAQKSRLGTIAQLGILSIVLVGAVKSGVSLSESTGTGVALGQWISLGIIVLVAHLSVLAMGYGLAGRLGGSGEDARAVGIAGSQKTLMVGLDLAIRYSASLGEFAMLPMVAYHVVQLIADTFVADWWKRGDKELED